MYGENWLRSNNIFLMNAIVKYDPMVGDRVHFPLDRMRMIVDNSSLDCS